MAPVRTGLIKAIRFMWIIKQELAWLVVSS